MACLGAIAIVAAACGNSTGGTSASATVPAGLSVTSFDQSFSVMAQLKGLHDAGTGLVGGAVCGTVAVDGGSSARARPPEAAPASVAMAANARGQQNGMSVRDRGFTFTLPS